MNILKKYNYTLKNLDCAVCAGKIEDQLTKIEEFENVRVNFNTLRLTLETNQKGDIKKQIEKIIKKIEPDVEIVNINEKNIKNNKIKKSILKLGIGILLAFVSRIIPISKTVSSIFLIVAYIILLSRTFHNAFQLLKSSHKIDENFLITISCIGAYLVGEQMEGLMVIALYEIGKILEEKAVNRTRNSIQELMNIQPEYANLLENTEKKVAPEEVKIGSIIIVKKGEKIPIDGIVIQGNSMIDTSSLTGESKPVSIHENSEVLSGSINLGNVIQIKTTKTYKNSTVSKILELVENATDKKAKSETFASNFAKVYTPIVILLALTVMILMPLVADVTYYQSIYKALTFLVISCPCAIAISIPLSYFSGIGRASKSGILIKGSNYLDGLKNLTQIIFDKTGTLTTGSFELDSVNVLDHHYTKEQIQDYIIQGESLSTHPLAQSILKVLPKKRINNKITNFQEYAGRGICYNHNQQEIKIGSAEFVGVSDNQDTKGTIIYIKIGKCVIGNIVMCDKIKKDAKRTIQELHKLGIQTKMFTGDNKEIASIVAKQIGIKEFSSELLPNDKYQELEKLIKKENSKEKIAFVGDGINDSPVLTLADIGISMGGVGSAAAIEASDIVMMTDELNKIVEAIRISKKTEKIIKQNLFFAIGIKLLVLTFSIVGISNMWQAIFADVGVTLITILNTLRILKK